MSTRRPLLLPLVPLYGAALAVKRGMFRLGWLQQHRLPNPVISVGSVSAGGAGKTPMVLLLAKMLRQRGYAVRILTRGYKRGSAVTTRVEPFDDAAWYGDEPVLLAQQSGVPVFVGADRYEAGVLAERNEPSEKLVVHLLDDGFQHRQLARDVDIVLLTKEDVEDALLPAGNLREPLAALADADIVVLREEEVDSLRSVVSGLSWKKAPVIWVIRRRLSLGRAERWRCRRGRLCFAGLRGRRGSRRCWLRRVMSRWIRSFFLTTMLMTIVTLRLLLESARRVGRTGL